MTQITSIHILLAPITHKKMKKYNPIGIRISNKLEMKMLDKTNGNHATVKICAMMLLFDPQIMKLYALPIVQVLIIRINW